MRFRLSRSLTFWLGLPCLIFLLWAWADSFDWQSRASFRKTSGIWSVLSDGSSITFESIRYEPDAIPSPGEYEAPELPVSPSFDFDRSASVRATRPLLYAKLGTSTATYGSWRENALHLPYWMLVIAYLVVWFGVMAWRWSRGRRKPKVDLPGVESQGGSARANPSHR